MKKAIKKPLSIVLIIIAFACIAAQILDASALDDFEHGDKRMTVILEYGTTTVTPMYNIGVAICRVATVFVQGNGQLRFDLISPEFDDFVYNWPTYMDVSAGEIVNLTWALNNYVINNDIRRINEYTDVNGRAIFDNLEHGLYIVMQYNRTSFGPGSYYFSPSLVAIGRMGVETTEVQPKVQRVPYNPTPTPTPVPSETPTPTPSGSPTPTPGGSITPSPSLGAYEPTPTPGGGTPTPTGGTDIDIPDVPTTDFPPDGDKPGRLPQTGVIDWNLTIIVLTSFGVLLLLVGIILQKRRDQRS